jgi:putative sigma-54 modulation protein
MNVEYTGRHYEITPSIRKEVETGLAKIRKILSDKFETKVILVVEKRRHKAEITISPRNGPLVAIAQAGDMSIAIGEAIEHLEKQAIKYKTKWRTKKRKPHDKWSDAEPVETPKPVNGKRPNPVAAILVHKFPALSKSTEATLTPASDAVALRPMTVEEAIKEAAFRDRDVFVFRDPKGKVMVLHRTREGKMELIEAPS